MYLSTQWDGTPSFRLMPIDISCPYAEAIFIPQRKMLAVIGKEPKTEFKFIPKVDEYGQPMLKGGTGQNGVDPVQKEERMLLDFNWEYQIYVKEEIEEFLEMFAGGVPKNWEDYFKVAEPQQNAEAPLKLLNKDGE